MEGTYAQARMGRSLGPTSAIEREASSTERLNDQLRNTLEAMRALTARIDSFADRTVGASAPTTIEKSSNIAGVPSGSLGALSMTADSLQTEALRALELFSRVEFI